MFQKLKRFRWKTSLTTLHKPFKKFFLFLHDFSILVGEKMTQFTQCTKNSSPPHFQLLCQMVKLFRGERGLKVPKFYFCNSNIEKIKIPAKFSVLKSKHKQKLERWLVALEFTRENNQNKDFSLNTSRASMVTLIHWILSKSRPYCNTYNTAIFYTTHYTQKAIHQRLL